MFSPRDPECLGKRSFLAACAGLAGAMVFAGFLRPWAFAETRRAYTLAPESMLPADIRQALPDVREAYRFAIANRETLRYIPCYCGCGAEGHTSSTSCYLQDSSTPGNLVFDRMSLN